MSEAINSVYGKDFMNLFDIVIDYSSYSNRETLGTKFQMYQDNYFLDRFSHTLDMNYIDYNEDKIFNYKDLKCFC